MSAQDGCYIDIAGDGVAVEHGRRLVLRSSRGWRFDVEGPTTYVAPDGAVEPVPPATAGGRLERLIARSGRVISSCAAFVDGRLELTFDDGARLRVAPRLAGEAWVAVGPRGTRIVSLPGGALALSR